MRGFLLSFVGATLVAGFGQILPANAQPEVDLARSDRNSSSASACPALANARQYDVIVFGDEVPGVMSALKVQQELQARRQSSKVALITEGDTTRGIGGHLVRGGLAYLDRNQVPADLQSQFGVFGRPSRLYQSFLSFGRVNTIALDRYKIAPNFSRALAQANIDVIDKAELGAVQTAGNVICGFTAGRQTYGAKQFIDASQSGELAAASGVAMMQGLEALGFPDSALSIGLVFDLYGVDIEQLKRVESELIARFFNPQDEAAQRWLTVASGNHPEKRQYLLQSLLDYYRRPKVMYQATPDSADVRSLAFSILVHGYLGYEYDLKSSGFLFDRANIAILDDRLSFNALLFYANSATARQLSRNGAKPTEEMQEVAQKIATLFEKMGVERVEIMEELYIRNAGQIANPIDELSATLMAAGGIPAETALGTFGYHLDDRGGIEGLDQQVDDSAWRLLDFGQMPIFNYGFRHTLPREKQNLAVLSPASGFGGLGTTAGRIVEFNVSVGEGLAIAIAQAIATNRSLQTITESEVRQAMGYSPDVYGYRTQSFGAISSLERRFRGIDYERNYLEQAQAYLDQLNYTEAARTVSRALTLNPRNAHAYYLRGVIQAESGDRTQAQADFEQAIALYQGQGDTSAASKAQGTLDTLWN